MKKKYIGPLLLIILSLVPIFVWFSLKTMEERFGGIIPSFVSLGQITALLGLTLFSFSLFLSTRLKLFDDYFGGMNKVYILHHLIGGIAFMLLLFHPLFLLTRTIPISLALSASFLLPGDYWAKDLGVYALSLMMILLFLTFFVSMRYEIWKGSHKLLGIAFFIGGYHSMLIYSDIQVSSMLRYYMIGVFFIGGASYFYKTVFAKWLIKKYSYKLINKQMLMEDVMVLTFRAEASIMPYQSGQFIFINFNSKFLPKEAHPFSISSNNQGNEFSLTIKTLGDYTSSLRTVQVGEVALVEGPFGRFNYKNTKNKNQIWIAGGIGVTPFVSMIKQLLSEKDQTYKIDFYFCTRTSGEQEIISSLPDDIKNLPNIKFIAHCSSDMGRVSGDFIKENSQNFSNSDIFMCGPLPMMKSLQVQLKNLKISSRKIFSEEFNF